MNQQTQARYLDFSLLILRVTLGLFFLIAGLAQVTIEATQYREVFSGFAILNEAAPYSLVGILFPWVEVIGGTLLIAGLATSLVAVIVALLTFVFSVVHGFTEGASLAKEIMFIIVALVLMLLGGGSISLDGHIKEIKERKGRGRK